MDKPEAYPTEYEYRGISLWLVGLSLTSRSALLRHLLFSEQLNGEKAQPIACTSVAIRFFLLDGWDNERTNKTKGRL
jgi:hypothetical protein